MTESRRIDRGLWSAFGVLFILVVAAAFLPTRPVIGVFPAWGFAVLLAAIGTFAAALLAVVGFGWPVDNR